MILDKTVPSLDIFTQMSRVLFYESSDYGIENVGYGLVVDVTRLQGLCNVIINPITLATGLPD